MSEIKFKYIVQIKNKQYPIFLTLNQIMISYNFPHLIMDELYYKFDIDEFTRAQYKIISINKFVGKQDKNKTDLYVGDKVKVPLYYSEDKFIKYIVGIIIEEDAQFIIQDSTGKKWKWMDGKLLE